MITRRQFIHTAACVGSTAAVTFILAPLGCSSSEGAAGETTSTNPTVPCDGLGSRSTNADGHTHDLCVPAADLSDPPAGGASYTTTNNDGHTHAVALDAAQLSALERGESVRVTTSSDAGHTHAYTLVRAGTISVPSPGGGTSGGTGPY